MSLSTLSDKRMFLFDVGNWLNRGRTRTCPAQALLTADASWAVLLGFVPVRWMEGKCPSQVGKEQIQPLCIFCRGPQKHSSDSSSLVEKSCWLLSIELDISGNSSCILGKQIDTFPAKSGVFSCTGCFCSKAVKLISKQKETEYIKGFSAWAPFLF